jgi:hypothetical protein
VRRPNARCRGGRTILCECCFRLCGAGERKARKRRKFWTEVISGSSNHRINLIAAAAKLFLRCGTKSLPHKAIRNYLLQAGLSNQTISQHAHVVLMF